MKLKELTNYLEINFPVNISEEWDNVGLLVGKKEQETKKILISLDVTDKVIDEAIKIKANLIITHHPLIFKSIKKITDETILGKKILRLIENKISVYTMHTNLDSGKNGLNDFLGEDILGFENGKILNKNEKNKTEYGIGRVYRLENSILLSDLIHKIKEKLNIKNINLISKNKIKEIKKIALINGAGSSFWKEAKKQGADILITGDIKYHDALDASENSFILLDIGHYESEAIFTKYLKKIISQKYDDVEIFEFNDGPIIEKV